MPTEAVLESPRSEASKVAAATASPRVMSIDALRGMDMFFIVGMEEVFEASSKMFPMQPTLWSRLDHAPWAGFHFYDLIFPLFAFIIGVSAVFSLTKSIAVDGKAGASIKTIKRGLILFILGLFIYKGIADGVERIRLLGVLQRLAICSCIGGLAFIWLNTRALIALAATLLVGYWAMMTFIPLPGFGAGDFAEGHNLANYIDKMYLPWRKWDGDHDPEGLLSTLPAIASTLLGIFAGLVIKNPQVAPERKVRLLLMWGVGGIVVALLWHLQFPIIKKIWSSSFVLFTAGISSILLATFYWIIDIKNHRRWATPFVWIGSNAIGIYMIFHLTSMTGNANRFLGGPIKAFINGRWTGLGDLVIALAALSLSLLTCRFLYQRKIFLRV